MPGLPEFDKLSQTYSLAIAVLIFTVIGLAIAVIKLYRENLAVWGRIEALLTARVENYEALLTETFNDKRPRQ